MSLPVWGGSSRSACVGHDVARREQREEDLRELAHGGDGVEVGLAERAHGEHGDEAREQRGGEHLPRGDGEERREHGHAQPDAQRETARPPRDGHQLRRRRHLEAVVAARLGAGRLVGERRVVARAAEARRDELGVAGRDVGAGRGGAQDGGLGAAPRRGERPAPKVEGGGGASRRPAGHLRRGEASSCSSPPIGALRQLQREQHPEGGDRLGEHQAHRHPQRPALPRESGQIEGLEQADRGDRGGRRDRGDRAEIAPARRAPTSRWSPARRAASRTSRARAPCMPRRPPTPARPPAARGAPTTRAPVPTRGPNA